MESTSLPLVPIAKALGITSSLFLAGMTTAYSYIVIPSILDKSSETTLVGQWRTAYRIGLFSQPPQCLVASASWTYLALTVPSDAVGLRVLYGAAAVLIPSIVPFTIFVGHKLIGRLNQRAESLCGPVDGTKAASAEKLQDNTDESTQDLVKQWSRFNYIRAAVVTVGGVCGVWASLNEAFLSGIQVGANAIITELVKQQALAKTGVQAAQ